MEYVAMHPLAWICLVVHSEIVVVLTLTGQSALLLLLNWVRATPDRPFMICYAIEVRCTLSA
jgi:hypothetical protein